MIQRVAPNTTPPSQVGEGMVVDLEAPPSEKRYCTRQRAIQHKDDFGTISLPDLRG